LAEVRFPEAIVAFQQARELTPKHPYIAGRLAEVARRQQAASAAPLVQPPV
jgi:cytochrome c-type biogenesis protein CcmH/NrfG